MSSENSTAWTLAGCRLVRAVSASLYRVIGGFFFGFQKMS